MSITSIPAKFFDTKIDLQRRHLAPDSVGDPVETWNTYSTDAPASVQNVKTTEERKLWQGKEYSVNRKAYVPIAKVKVPASGDRLLDKETGKLYDVIYVDRFQAARKDIAFGHHYRIYLLEIVTPHF